MDYFDDVSIDIIRNNGLEKLIQINTITVSCPHTAHEKLWLTQLEHVAFL